MPSRLIQYNADGSELWSICISALPCTTRGGPTMSDLKLTPDARAALIRELQGHFSSEFDEDLSDFRAETLLDIILKAVAPSVYNQAVQDVRAYLQGRLDDLDGEVFLD